MTDPTRDDESAQALMTRELMARALDGEPDLRLDLGEVRAEGRRRRRARRGSWVGAGGVVAVLAVAVAAGTGALPGSGTARSVQPAGPDTAVTTTAPARTPDQRTVAEQEAAGNAWRARAMEAVVGALAQQASAVPVQQLPLVEDVTTEDGRSFRRGYVVVDVVGVADDRADRADLTITVHTPLDGAGPLPTDSVPTGEPGGCEILRPACEQEERPDGSVLRWGTGTADEGTPTVVAELVTGRARVQVTSTGRADGDLPPALTVAQVRQVALAHVLTKPLP